MHMAKYSSQKDLKYLLYKNGFNSSEPLKNLHSQKLPTQNNDQGQKIR